MKTKLLNMVDEIEIYFLQSIFHDRCNLQVSSSNITMGQQVLQMRGLNFSDYFYWISVGALLGFWMVFNIGITCAMSYSKCNFIPSMNIFEKMRNKKNSGGQK